MSSVVPRENSIFSPGGEEGEARNSPRSSDFVSDGEVSINLQPATSAAGEDCPQSSSPPRAEPIPPVLLLRHRMGYSAVKLTEKQRNTYSWEELEDFLLYKEQKYGAVNVLGRFSVFLLLVATFCIFCLAFSMSSTEWRVVRHRELYQAVGIFVSCHERRLRQCTDRTSSRFSRTAVDSVTGAVRCSTSTAFVDVHTGLMWTFGILQLLALVVVVVLCFRVASRPTRTHAVVTCVWLMLGCSVCGIVNCVLFNNYVKCDKQICLARHEGEPLCETKFSWGYSLYIAGTSLTALCAFMALCMYSYVQNIRSQAHRQMRTERRRRNYAAGGGSSRQSIDFHDDMASGGFSSAAPLEPMPAKLHLEPLVTTTSASPSPPVNPPLTAGGGKKQSRHTSQHVSFQHVGRSDSVDETAGTPQAHSQSHHNRPASSSRDFRVFDRDYDPELLTAAELDVTIEGATDWVYDDKSDMYYSFERHMFWDPVTSEYYNCALKSWQENPDHAVEVRNAMGYILHNNNNTTANYQEEVSSAASSSSEPEEGMSPHT